MNAQRSAAPNIAVGEVSSGAASHPEFAMTALLPLLRASSRTAKSGIPASSYRLLGCVRHGSVTTWNQDWRPGQFPVTPEERAAAAKKYGLLVEDYEPMPYGEWGDYPKIPDVGGAAKDPYYNWDDPHTRRNFGEPLHLHWDCLTEDRFEAQSEVKGYFPKGRTYGQMLRHFLTIMIVAFLVYYSTCNVVVNYPIMPKQYPSDVAVKGMKHYTFEIECDD